MNTIPPFTPKQHAITGFGLDAPSPAGLRTQLESLFSLATTLKKPGMRLALGIKASHFIRRNFERQFIGYEDKGSVGFTYLCHALAHHSDPDVRGNLRELLKNELAWANQFLPQNLQQAPPSDEPPDPMPPRGWELLHELAGGHGQTGTEYALRMFTKPVVIGGRPPCQNCAYFFQLFNEELPTGPVRTRIDIAFTKPEFAPFAHLALPPHLPPAGSPVLMI